MGNKKSKINQQQHRKTQRKVSEDEPSKLVSISSSSSYWSGYINYFTLNDCDQFIYHIWQLYADCIKIYEKEPFKPERKIKEIPLSSIVKVKQAGLDDTDTIQDSKMPLRYLFLLETNENEIYFCGKGKINENDSINKSKNELVRRFFDMFKMVYLPYENKSINKFVN